MVALIVVVLGVWLHVAEAPVCLNSTTSAYVDARCTSDAVAAENAKREKK